MDTGKLKRQIEILAMCLPENRDRIDVADLSMLFRVGEATINRDLQDLRKRKIPINSVAKKGIVITAKIEGSVLKKELLGYIGHLYSEHLIEAVGGYAGYSDYIKMLENFVTLNMAVENRKIVKIIFKGKNHAQALEPVMITRVGREWELIMKDKTEYQHRKISEIENVYSTDGKYSGFDKKEVENYVNKISDGKVSKHTIKLLLATKLDGKFPEHIIHTVVSKIGKDGRIIIDGKCNSLEELANWVIANSDIAEVLEPEPLIKIVVKKATEVLHQYQTGGMVMEIQRNYMDVNLKSEETDENKLSVNADMVVSDENIEFKTIERPKALFQIKEGRELLALKYYSPSQKDFWEYPYAIEF